MVTQRIYETFADATLQGKKLLAILIDPDKFDFENAASFLRTIPDDTTHLFVGGSTVANGETHRLVETLKLCTARPIIIFPGHFTQITEAADGLLFLSLLSGRNSEYLIGQQVKAAARLVHSTLEVIPTGYILVDGGNESAVARVTGTSPMPQENVQQIVDTAKAGVLMGAKLIYLEAGSGAMIPVSALIITQVKKEIGVPLIVGGGIRSEEQKQLAYKAGADMVVMGTVFEKMD